jgi:hypothetical protein
MLWLDAAGMSTPLTVEAVEIVRSIHEDAPSPVIRQLCDYWLAQHKRLIEGTPSPEMLAAIKRAKPAAQRGYPRITEPPAAPVPNQGWGGHPKPKPKAKARKRRSSKRLTK